MHTLIIFIMAALNFKECINGSRFILCRPSPQPHYIPSDTRVCASSSQTEKDKCALHSQIVSILLYLYVVWCTYAQQALFLSVLCTYEYEL
jgi:hypothetical protein